MTDDQKEKERRQTDYLTSKCGFSTLDILNLRSRNWTPGRIIAQCKRLEELTDENGKPLGFHGEEYYREHFFEWLGTLPEEHQPEQEEPRSDDSIVLRCFLPLDQFEMREAEWLIPGYIPKGQIVILASDGGIGKTSVWVNLAAAISSGSQSLFGEEPRKPGKVLYLSTEDSTSIILKKRLLNAKGAESGITAPNFEKAEGEEKKFLEKVKFGSIELDQTISKLQPDLCIFDPIQGFVPKGTQMGDRAAMRACLAPLIPLGEKYGTTFLIICHSNKQRDASGRNRIADSADLWDIARSVLMVGWTEEDGVRYLSHEKCNYGKLQKTITFTVDEIGNVNVIGTTDKRDRDFQSERNGKSGSKPTVREDCKTWLIRTLEENGGKMQIKELDQRAESSGFSEGTLKRAKAEAAKENKTRYYNEGYGDDKTYYIELTYFAPLPSESFS